MSTKIEIYSHSIDIALLENRTTEITSRIYLTSIGNIVGSCSNLRSLLLINCYTLGIIWGKNCIFLLDSHSKCSNGNICQNGISVLLTIETLNKSQEYIKDIYYIGLRYETLHFQTQFKNLLYSSNKIKIIKSNVALERCFQKLKCVINGEPNKSQSKPFAQNKSSLAKDEKLKSKEGRVKLFKKKKWKRPYFNCTIEIPVLYQLYHPAFLHPNYKEFRIDFVTKATYDRKVHLRMTCYRSIMKKRTPSQAVSTKLDVKVPPNLQQNLRKLEKIDNVFQESCNTLSKG